MAGRTAAKPKNAAVVATEFFPYATIALLLACAGATLTFNASGQSELFICFPREPFQLFGVPTLLSLFAHENFVHLGGNGAVLLLAGTRLERRIGPAPLIALFFLCGLAGIAGQAAVTAKGTIGASGAICGVVTALLAGGSASERASPWTAVWALWLAWDFLGFQAQPVGGWIGHGAHLGGALAGLFLSLTALHLVKTTPPFSTRLP